MSTLKKDRMLIKTVLVWQSAVTGIIFLVIAIITLCKPSFAGAVESFACFTNAKALAMHWSPNLAVETIIVSASFLLGVLNTLFFLAVSVWRR